MAEFTINDEQLSGVKGKVVIVTGTYITSSAPPIAPLLWLTGPKQNKT